MNKQLMTLEDPLDWMNGLFSASPLASFFAQPALSGGCAGWAPRVDIRETKEAYEIDAALPGVKKEDVKVEFTDGRLVLSGSTKRELKEDRDGWVRRELSAGSFHRSFLLPEGTDPGKVTAKFADGLLEVRIPKSEGPQPRSIDIK